MPPASNYISAFQLHLNDPILSGLACIPHYDGKHPCLTCATSGGKIFIHSPHQRADEREPDALNSDIRYLNLNKKTTSLSSGAFDPATANETLLVGTQTSVLAYNVEKNSDVFYKEVPDGVGALAFSAVGGSPPLALVGGNCSIQGFDREGGEAFWTVTGDVVTALTTVDVNGDGRHELVVGSADAEIRIFQDEEVVAECTEADRPVSLCALQHGGRWGYALANGTIGLYKKDARTWRVKSKNDVGAIVAFDLDGDGVPELVSGWSNGKVEARRESDGEVIFRAQLGAEVAALLTSDYRLDGTQQLICCSVDGEVRGYASREHLGEDGFLDSLRSAQEENLASLAQLKQELLYKLATYEPHTAAAKAGKEGSAPGTFGGPEATAIPSSTKVSLGLQPSVSHAGLDLHVATNNGTVVRGVILTADGALERESIFSFCRDPQPTARVPLAPPKDVAAVLHAKVLVGNRGTPAFHCFELNLKLPKFAMYVAADAAPRVRPPSASTQGAGPASSRLPSISGPSSVGLQSNPPHLGPSQAISLPTPAPQSSVIFTVAERPQRLLLWLNDSFLTSVPVQPNSSGDGFSVRFVSLRDGRPLGISMEGGGKLVVRTDDMDVAGDVVQDLCASLGIAELESRADFPLEEATFREVVRRVEAHNGTRVQLASEVADTSNLLKAMVIRAEDARLLLDMQAMKKGYGDLFRLNEELIGEHTKRSTNQTELLAALKEVNQLIQRAAKLRVGFAKTEVVAACRNCVKGNNIQALIQVMRMGHVE